MEVAKNSFCECDTANTEMILKIINDNFAYYSNLDLELKKSHDSVSLNRSAKEYGRTSYLIL
jgi:hypothetical protein